MLPAVKLTGIYHVCPYHVLWHAALIEALPALLRLLHESAQHSLRASVILNSQSLSFCCAQLLNTAIGDPGRASRMRGTCFASAASRVASWMLSESRPSFRWMYAEFSFSRAASSKGSLSPSTCKHTARCHHKKSAESFEGLCYSMTRGWKRCNMN